MITYFVILAVYAALRYQFLEPSDHNQTLHALCFPFCLCFCTAQLAGMLADLTANRQTNRQVIGSHIVRVIPNSYAASLLTHIDIVLTSVWLTTWH